MPDLDRDQDGRMRRPGPPIPRPCKSPACDETIVFLPSYAHEGRNVCVRAKELRAFILVAKEDPGRLATADEIRQGEAVARNVPVFLSHHAPYPGVLACPDAPQFSRSRKSPTSSPTRVRRA